jgi:hypothetical protein
MVSPPHAMGYRYLTLLWPLLAVLVTSLLWRSAPGRLVASALCIALLAASLSWLWGAARKGAGPVVVPDPRRPVLIDSAERGVLPPVLWHAAPQTRVFAASQRHLLEHPAVWLDTLGDEPLYAATAIGHRTTQKARDRLLALLRTRYLKVGPRQLSRSADWFSWRRMEREGGRLEPAAARSDR